MTLHEDAMKKTRKTLAREFKLEAVKMMTGGGRSAKDVEKSLGIGCGMLYRWKAQFAAEGDPRSREMGMSARWKPRIASCAWS